MRLTKLQQEIHDDLVENGARLSQLSSGGGYVYEVSCGDKPSNFGKRVETVSMRTADSMFAKGYLSRVPDGTSLDACYPRGTMALEA